MTTRAPGDRFRLWPAVRPYVRIVVLAALPVPDLLSRRRVRRAASRLVTCSLWPGMQATGDDAAQLALLRLLHLQQAARRAVRTRQDEAATMLARVAIETLITGLYCLYEPTAVARLQGAQVKMMRAMLDFMVEEGHIPADVLDECIRRLDAGAPTQGPSVKDMAARVDAATSGTIAVSLYNRFYRPTSNLALHAGAASLLRHVRSDGRLTGRPQRVWGRRAPARIADACLGTLTAYLASGAGDSWRDTARRAARYADRHHERAIPPVIAISLAGLGRGIRLRRIGEVIGRIGALGEYVGSSEDADDLAARTAWVRAEMEYLLSVSEMDIPEGSLDPFLDYVAAKIASAGTDQGA